MSTRAAALAIALVLGLAPTLADVGQVGRHRTAQHKLHPRHVARAPVDNVGAPDTAPGAAIRAQARINQNAPGVTNELAPDNIATATGGPSGGVPGFSGR